jgi:hypothetical protein
MKQILKKKNTKIEYPSTGCTRPYSSAYSPVNRTLHPTPNWTYFAVLLLGTLGPVFSTFCPVFFFEARKLLGRSRGRERPRALPKKLPRFKEML